MATTRASETDGLSSHVAVIIFFVIPAVCIGATIILLAICCRCMYVRSKRRMRRKPMCAAATQLKARGSRDQEEKKKHSQPRPHAVLPTSLPSLARNTIIDNPAAFKVRFANPLCAEATAQSYYSQQVASSHPPPDLHDITDNETDDGLSYMSHEGTWGSADSSCTRFSSSYAPSSIIHIAGTSSDEGEQQEVWV